MPIFNENKYKKGVVTMRKLKIEIKNYNNNKNLEELNE